jgi:hypothetical protein
LYDANGQLLGELYERQLSGGKQEIPLSVKGIEQGFYRAVIRLNGEMIQQLPVEVKQ